MNIRDLLTRLGTGVNNLGQGLTELQGDPMFNMGVGLLAAGGRRPGQRVSFGQGLLEAGNYMDQKQADFQKLEANRQALAQAKQQRAAQQGIVGLLNMPAAASVPAAIRRPNVQQSMNNQMMGLLAQADPQGFTQAMTSSLLAPADPSQELADMLRTLQAQDLLATRQQDRDELERTERGADANRRDVVAEVSKLTDLLEATNNTNVRTGSFSQAFNTANEFRGAIERMAGVDSSDADRLAGQFDMMNKGFERLLTDLIPEGTTNMGLQRLQDANAGVTLTPGANASLLADALDGVMRDHFVYYGNYDELDVDKIKEIQGRLYAIRDAEMGDNSGAGAPGLPGNNSTPPGGSVGDINLLNDSLGGPLPENFRVVPGGPN